MTVLDEVMIILDFQRIPFDEFPVLEAVHKKHWQPGDECFLHFYSYNYGFIQGKRAERAKRRTQPTTAI